MTSGARRTALFAAIVAVAMLSVVGYEQVTGSFLRFVDAVTVSFLICVALAAIGSTLRVSAKSYGVALVVVIGGLQLLWYLPSGPREVFADTVSKIEVGMTYDEVEVIMEPYESGIIPQLSWTKGDSTTTYFEPPGEKNLFDCICLLSWEDGRVARVRFHAD